MEDLAKLTEKYSVADLGAVVNEAVMLAIREYVKSGSCKDDATFCEYKVGKKHFDEALKIVQPTGVEMDLYRKFQAKAK